MKNLRPSLRNSKDWPAQLVNRLGESISQSDDWQGTNRSWISCTRNWKASSPTISSAPTDAPMRSRLMSVARKQFVPRTVPSQKPLAQPSNPRSEEHTSELQSQSNLGCRLL